MRFYEKMNEYIALLGCKAKDVGAASGMSAATLSRYRSGERLPDVDSEAFEKLCIRNSGTIATRVSGGSTGRDIPSVATTAAKRGYQRSASSSSFQPSAANCPQATREAREDNRRRMSWISGFFALVIRSKRSSTPVSSIFVLLIF